MFFVYSEKQAGNRKVKTRDKQQNSYVKKVIVKCDRSRNMQHIVFEFA